MVTLPGGRFWSFCCCAAVLGVMTLKPDATSMLSLFCVLVDVLAQPIVSSSSAAALIILNNTICFILLAPCGVRFVLGWVCCIHTKEVVQECRRMPCLPVDQPLVHDVPLTESMAE